MSNLKGFAIFAMGAAVGSAASWYFLKTKYERFAQEEIDSVKAVFSKRSAQEEQPEENDISPKVEDSSTMMDYAKKLDEEKYIDYSSPEVASKSIDKTDIVTNDTAPYVITPDEFGDLEEYSEISLTYYADKVLADDLDYPVEDIPGTVGFGSLSRFGEYEDDSVFVRNDRLKCDYEILLDYRRYEDVLKTLPPR